MGKITEKNTKATILKALREAEKKISELEQGKLRADKETTEKKATETTTKANQLIEESIEEKITDLSKSVNNVLRSIGEDIAEQSENLQTVKEAISLKESELKELYGIEKNAHTLAGLVNAHQELKLAQEQELADSKEKAITELEEIQSQIKQARESYEEQIKEQSKKLSQDKKRQEEEFQYDFERKKKQSNDQLEDELYIKRKQFDQEVEKQNREIAEIKKELDEREKNIGKREEKMDELEKEVASIPDQIAEAKAEIDEKANAKIKKQIAIREASFRKEIEADKRILESERDSLKEQLEARNETIFTLQEKLDEAYNRIQSMGIKMVSGTNESRTYDKIAELVSEKRKEK